MTLARALQVAAGNSQESADVAGAIDFDGTSDSLSSGSAIPGNTGTFSFWLWVPSGSAQPVYRELMTSGLEAVKFSHNGSSTLSITFYNSNGGQTQAGTVGVAVAVNTWTHILFSVDRTAAGSSPVYVNDIQSGTLTLSQDALAARNNVTLPRNSGSPSHGKLRLSNFLVRNGTYDFSNVANRRLFVTADLKPAADQAALNPLIYLPLNDPTAPGVNAGTGGNFTMTGTVTRSGRGPNQYNAPYSDLDGAADYLERTTAPTGIANGKQFTISFNISPDTADSVNRIIGFGSTQNIIFMIHKPSNKKITITANSASISGVLAAEVQTPLMENGRNYNITISIDMSNTSKRHCYINGLPATVSYFAYNNDDIGFNITATPRYRIGTNITTTPNDYWNGRLGALYFNTSYIDLSQPANLAKFVTGTGIDAKPVDLGANGELPTGTSPLIYLPMYGNNAGKNYGTGGDFTVNSGPYTGARGPNEFWSGSGLFNNPTQTELSALTLNNSPDVTGVTKTTFAVCFKRRDVDVTDNSIIFNTTSSTNNNFHFSVYFNSSEQLVVGWNGHTVATSSAITDTNWHTLLVSVDSTATVARVYLDNVSVSATITLNRTYTQAFTYVGRATGVSADQCFDGNIGFVYQAHDYIDISQEANRLKFFDAFGYPVNLTQQIEDGAIPAAYIYLLFPESNLGTNNGTAGDFTNNSVTASALVKA